MAILTAVDTDAAVPVGIVFAHLQPAVLTSPPALAPAPNNLYLKTDGSRAAGQTPPTGARLIAFAPP